MAGASAHIARPLVRKPSNAKTREMIGKTRRKVYRTGKQIFAPVEQKAYNAIAKPKLFFLSLQKKKWVSNLYAQKKAMQPSTPANKPVKTHQLPLRKHKQSTRHAPTSQSKPSTHPIRVNKTRTRKEIINDD